MIYVQFSLIIIQIFSLSERKNIIVLSDENLCLNDCNYSYYDIKTLRTVCLSS